jgi:putative PIN family toxin of toxin-antitoxin system
VPRVVLDTVVFVRALINPNSRSGRLLFDEANRYTLIISPATARELIEAIQRPGLSTKYKGLKTINVRNVIEILAKAEAVEIEEISPVSRDPKDDIFLATAIAGRADYLVSEDKDLLVLKQFIGIRIIDTHEFLELLKSI